MKKLSIILILFFMQCCANFIQYHPDKSNSGPIIDDKSFKLIIYEPVNFDQYNFITDHNGRETCHMELDISGKNGYPAPVVQYNKFIVDIYSNNQPVKPAKIEYINSNDRIWLHEYNIIKLTEMINKKKRIGEQYFIWNYYSTSMTRNMSIHIDIDLLINGTNYKITKVIPLNRKEHRGLECD